MATVFDNLIQTDSRCLVNEILDIGLLNPQNGGTETMPSHRERRPLDGSAGKNQRLGWLAHSTAGAEGFWRLTDTEGEVPENLNGTLYRTSPGQKENHGVALPHLFARFGTFILRTFENLGLEEVKKSRVKNGPALLCKFPLAIYLAGL